MDDQEQVLLELSFPEITTVSSQKYVSPLDLYPFFIDLFSIAISHFNYFTIVIFRTNKMFTQTFNLSTVRGEEFTFQSPNAEDIRDLVVYFLEGLKKRSKYVIALQDYKAPGEGSSFLTFQKGDLIILEEESTGETVLNSGWCVGTCERTGEKGDFPAETVYVLPSLTKPPNDILVIRTHFFTNNVQYDIIIFIFKPIVFLFCIREDNLLNYNRFFFFFSFFSPCSASKGQKMAENCIRSK